GADLATIYALARHFYLGKVDEKAYRTNRVAAEIAARLYAPGIAREHLERALESFRRLHPEDLAGETELILELAQQIDAVGELEEAETLLRGHLTRTGLGAKIPRPLLALAELYLARIQADRGDWRAAEEAATRILGRPELLEHPLVLLAVPASRRVAVLPGTLRRRAGGAHRRAPPRARDRERAGGRARPGPPGPRSRDGGPGRRGTRGRGRR